MTRLDEGGSGANLYHVAGSPNQQFDGRRVTTW